MKRRLSPSHKLNVCLLIALFVVITAFLAIHTFTTTCFARSFRMDTEYKFFCHSFNFEALIHPKGEGEDKRFHNLWQIASRYEASRAVMAFLSQ